METADARSRARAPRRDDGRRARRAPARPACAPGSRDDCCAWVLCELERIVRQLDEALALALEAVELHEPGADAGRALHPSGLRDEQIGLPAVLGLHPARAGRVDGRARD